MICWWCGRPLTDPFGHPVKGVEIETTLLPGVSKVRTHRICSFEAREYLTPPTAQPKGT